MANVGDQLLVPEDDMRRIEQDNPYIGYYGNFTPESYSDHSGGSCLYTTTKGDTIDITVYTSKFYFISITNTDRTNAIHTEVYIDGELDDSFSSYGERVFQYLMYKKEFPEKEWHRFQFKNVASNGMSLCIDAIDIDKDGKIFPARYAAINSPINGMRRYSPLDLYIKYNGTFTDNGKVKYTDIIGDTIEFYFYGKRVCLLDNVYNNRSNAIIVTVDDEIVTIDEQGANTHNIVVYDSLELEEKVHKVTIVNNSTNSKKRMGLEWIDIDGRICDKTGKYIDMTPTLTSNNAPAPYAVTQSSSWNNDSKYNGWKCFNRTLYDMYDAWVTYRGDITGCITIDMGVETKINAIAITSRLRVSDSIDSSPRNFSVYGSNDGGATYKLIKTFRNCTNWDFGETRIFDFDKTVCYRMYKFDITENDGNELMISIGEISLLFNTNINFYLLKVDGVYKNYDEETNTLVDVADPSILNKPLFENDCINDIKKAIDLLPSLENVKLVTNKNTDVQLMAIRDTSELIVMRADTYTNQIAEINKIFIDGHIDESVSVKFAVSSDSGFTWNVYSNGWRKTAITIPQGKYESFNSREIELWNLAKNQIKTNGIELDVLDTLDFNSLDAEKLRFAIVITINDYSDIANIDAIMWNIKMNSYYKECCQTEIERTIVGNAIKLHSNIEASKIKVNIVTAGVTNGGAFDYNNAENIPVFNGVKFVGVLESDDVGVASKKSVELLNARIDALTGDRIEYLGYFSTEEDRDLVVLSPQKGDWCVVDSSTNPDEKYKGKSIKYTYQNNGWEIYMVIPTGTVQIDDNDISNDKTWSSEKINNELDKKEGVKGEYLATIDSSLFEKEESGKYEGFYKTNITHNLKCNKSFGLKVFNLDNQTFDLGVFVENIQDNEFDLYSITKQTLSIIVKEV